MDLVRSSLVSRIILVVGTRLVVWIGLVVGVGLVVGWFWQLKRGW